MLETSDLALNDRTELVAVVTDLTKLGLKLSHEAAEKDNVFEL